MMKRIIYVWIGLGLLVLPTTTIAATYNVNLTDDTAIACTEGTGICSLRGAIIAANQNPGFDTINIPSGEYVLNIEGREEDAALTGDLDVMDDLKIVGAGSESTVIQGADMDDLIFDLHTGNIQIERLKIYAGWGGDDTVGGVVNHKNAALTMNNCTISACRGAKAGGLYNEGNVVLSQSEIIDNWAWDGAGGITNHGQLIVDSCSILANGGGECSPAGISNFGVLTLTNSTISGNYGGFVCSLTGSAIHNWGGEVLIQNSTIADNVRDSWLGIANTGEVSAGVIRFKNSIILDGCDGWNGKYQSLGHNILSAGCYNKVDYGGGQWQIFDDTPPGATVNPHWHEYWYYDMDAFANPIRLAGDGLENGYRLLTGDGEKWHNSTHFIISWNMDYSEPFMIYIDLQTTAGHRYIMYQPKDEDKLGDEEYVRIGLGSNAGKGTYVRDLAADLEKAQPGVEILAVDGFLIRGSGIIGMVRLQKTISGNETGNGDIFIDPLLDELADNGGPTQTHALLDGSPALDAADDGNCPAIDQRGVARPQDGDGDGEAACDIGAYEYNYENDIKSSTYKIPVLMLAYYPDENQDGLLDYDTVGWETGGKSVAQKKIEVAKMATDLIETLEQGSTYHGYKDPRTRASLEYTIVESKQFNIPIPPSQRYQPFADHFKILVDLDICDQVENQGLKEVWIWMYHTDAISPIESNMAGPYGDISNSYRQNDLPQCEKTYTVYNYNYGRTVSEATENHMHQIEHVLNFIDGRDHTPSNQWDELLFWGNFVGSDYSHKIIKPSCGWTHYPPNGESDYDWKNQSYVQSDCEDWRPDGSGEVLTFNCEKWDCNSLKFFKWWMQNLPGYGNDLYYQGAKLKNWWSFIGDFDEAMAKGVSLSWDNNGIFAPIAVFTADPITGPNPLTAIFTDKSIGEITSWQWNFGDGSPVSTDQNPTHTYPEFGSYTVSLTIKGPNGSGTETRRNFITVACPLIAGNIIDSSGTPIEGVSVFSYNPKKQVLTDQEGYYQYPVCESWTGGLNFKKSGYYFSPPFIKYEDITTDQANQNAIGIIAPHIPTPIAPYDGETISTYTPTFEWSPFQSGGNEESQAGYWVRVKCVDENDEKVYDTGPILDTTGHFHTYQPGTYAISKPLEHGKRYRWHVRYRDTGGAWSAFSGDFPQAYQNFDVKVMVSVDFDEDGDVDGEDLFELIDSEKVTLLQQFAEEFGFSHFSGFPPIQE